jgi:adenylate cyclase
MAYELAGEYYSPLEVQLVKEYFGLEDKDMKLVRGEGLYLGKTMVPLDEKARLLINYYGPFGSFKYYPFADLVDGLVEPEAFRDKIVLVGGAATGLGDVWTTPFEESLPGVEKHATVISNILMEDFLQKLSPLVDVIFIIAVGLALGFILPRTSSVKGVAFSLLALAVVLVLNFSLFSVFRMWANLVWPLMALFSVSTCVITYQFFTEEKEKRQIKMAFKHYLNPVLVEELAKDPSGLHLGGEEREMSVLFSDIRGFTAISEGMSPESLVTFMNTYLSLMTKTIMQNNGVVDKFIGDAVMAIFGAPLYFENHAETACSTAVKMMEELRDSRHVWQEMGFPEINIGIGINTGPMVVGNMGSEDRFDYTVMGDSVNLASRLEGLCKVYGAGIVVSQLTASKAGGGSFRELDLVKVKGKEHPERIFELLVEANEEELSEYAEALQLYRQRLWPQAFESFRHLLGITGHPLFRLYEQRCQNFLEAPPPDDWDGVFRIKEK